jgi:hypothetical protein
MACAGGVYLQSFGEVMARFVRVLLRRLFTSQQLFVLLVISGAAVGATAQVVGPAGKPDAEAVQQISAALRKGNCPAVLQALNDRLPGKHPGVFLLAGSLYEDGLCLKANWERAIDMYLAAHRAGASVAAAHLAAGYARPAAGPDKAAALWWALQADIKLPEPCTEPKPLLEDADRFVAALAAWPGQRLDACVYILGVQASIIKSMNRLSIPVDAGFQGSFRFNFNPAAGAIEVVEEVNAEESATQVVTSDDRRSQKTKAVSEALRRLLYEVTARSALSRYSRPDGIDPSWRLTTAYRVEPALR